MAREPPVKTYIADGESVPGDTEITVVPKNGYKAAKDAVFKINGKDTTRIWCLAQIEASLCSVSFGQTIPAGLCGLERIKALQPSSMTDSR